MSSTRADETRLRSAGSSDLQDPSKSHEHSPYIVVPGRFDPRAKAMLGHGADLVDDGNDVPVLASDGHGDGRMGLGVGRERHDDDGRAVERSRLRVLALRTRQGRVLRISAPCVGSRLTHHTSPRWGTAASRAADIGVVEALPFVDLRRQSPVGIRGVAGPLELALVRGQLPLEEPYHRGRTSPTRDRGEESGGEVIGKRKRDSHKS